MVEFFLSLKFDPPCRFQALRHTQELKFSVLFGTQKEAKGLRLKFTKLCQKFEVYKKLL